MKTILNRLIMKWSISVIIFLAIWLMPMGQLAAAVAGEAPANIPAEQAENAVEAHMDTKAESPAEAAATTQQGSQARGVVMGQLGDKETNEPLMYASLVLFRESDSTMVTGGITDEAGRFLIDEVPFGRYYLVVNYVGYPREEINDIRLSRAQPTHDMGELRIAPGAALLSEVTVEAARQLMEVGLDRRVINVDQELTSTGATALELMQNIPSVSVDFDGNVSLRGSTNVTILVDGRPSTLTGLDGSEALEQIPSEMIERIEVITNPSVRYDPDGTSGIINVVLKKDRRSGFNAMLSTSASTHNRYNASASFNYKLNGLNFFGNISGRLSDSYGFGNSMRTSLVGPQPSYLEQESEYNRMGNTYNGQLGMDYFFNPKTRLTLSVSNNYRNRGTIDETEYSDLNHLLEPRSLFRRETDFGVVHNGMSYNLNFFREFDQQYRELTLDVNLNTRQMDREQDYMQQLFGQDFEDPLTDMLLFESTVLDGSNWMFSVQADYVHPLGEDRKLELGFRSYIRELDTDFRFFNHQAGPGEWDDIYSNRFVYGEQVHAAYGVYSTMLGPYSLQAGMRLEQALVTADQRTTGEVHEKDYFSFYPSLHLRRNLENNQAVQLSYSRRINRPRNRNINPFVRYNSEYDISYGNPDLDPEYINSLELGYTRFWENTTINPSLFYRNTQGMMTRYRTMNEDGVTETTYMNLNRGLAYGAELIASQSITSWWRVSGTLSYFRWIVQGGEAQMDIENDSYSWSVRLNNNLDLGRGWTMQVNGYYRSPMVMLQGEMREMYAMDIGMRKNVLNNRGSLTFRVSDVFDTQQFRMFNYGDNFTQNFERKRVSRAAVLSFTYRINEFDRRNRERDNNGMDPGSIMDEFDDFE